MVKIADKINPKNFIDQFRKNRVWRTKSNKKNYSYILLNFFKMVKLLLMDNIHDKVPFHRLLPLDGNYKQLNYDLGFLEPIHSLVYGKYLILY